MKIDPAIYTMCPKDMTVSQTIDALLEKPELADKLIELREATEIVKAQASIVHDKYITRQHAEEQNNKVYKEYLKAYEEHSKSWDKHSDALRIQADIFIKTMREMMEEGNNG